MHCRYLTFPLSLCEKNTRTHFRRQHFHPVIHDGYGYDGFSRPLIRSLNVFYFNLNNDQWLLSLWSSRKRKITSCAYKSWSTIKHRLLKTICLVHCYQNVWCSLVTFRIWSQHSLSNQTKLQEVSDTCLPRTRLLDLLSLAQNKMQKILSGLKDALSSSQCLFLLSCQGTLNLNRIHFPCQTLWYQCFKTSLLGMLLKKLR